MDRKNILWISHLIPYPPKGGVLQRSHNLLKEVSRYHNIDLYALHQKGHQAGLNEIIESVSEIRRYCNDIYVAPIDCEATKYGKYYVAFKCLVCLSPYETKWLASGEMCRQLNKINFSDYDIIHSETVGLVSYIKFGLDKVYSLNHHNIESEMMLRRAKNERNILKKFYFYQESFKIRNLEKISCNKFNINLTCSALDSYRLKTITPNINVTEIENGVDLNYFTPVIIPQINRSLIFAGRMSWYPNVSAIKYFIDFIWPLLKKEIPDIKMTVVGKNPPDDIVSYGKADKNFSVTGYVDDVRPYMNSSLIYVCPIFEGGGTKLKILDAMAMGKAIVANPIACEGIEVEHGRHVLFANTPSDYVAHIKMLFENDHYREFIGRNARELVCEHYSFESIGRKLALKYSELAC